MVKKYILLIILLAHTCNIYSQNKTNCEEISKQNIQQCPSIYSADWFGFGAILGLGGSFQDKYVNICGISGNQDQDITQYTSECTGNFDITITSSDTFAFAGMKVNPSVCDTLNYTCYYPYNYNTYSGYQTRYNVHLNKNATYNFVVGRQNPKSTLESYWVRAVAFSPSNIYINNVTPTSVTVNWTGQSDTYIEYGPKGFYPGSDSIPNQFVIKDPSSPCIINGLQPNTIYDFYLRSHCKNKFSLNSQVIRQRTAIKCDTVPVLYCNNNNILIGAPYYFTIYDPGAWNNFSCGNCHDSPEFLYKFIPDSSTSYYFEHTGIGYSSPGWSILFKDANFGCNESNFQCIASGGSNSIWGGYTGPLIKGNTYFILIKYGCVWANSSGYFTIYCPHPSCSTSPDSIITNTGIHSICKGNSITLIRSGGILSTSGNFYWYKDSCNGTTIGVGNAINLTPDSTSTYYVRSEDSCGIGSCVSITIEVNPIPQITSLTSSSSIFCNNDSVALLANTNGYSSIFWYNDNTLINGTYDSVYYASASGNYKVIIYDSLQCSDTAQISITESIPIATITNAPEALCSIDTSYLSATSTNYINYAWTLNGNLISGTNDSLLEIHSPGLYNFSITDSVGCMASDSVSILNSIPSSSIIPNGLIPLCYTDTISLISTYHSTLQWFLNNDSMLNATNDTLYISDTGLVHLMMIDSIGCIASSDTVSIFAATDPVALIQPAGRISICEGDLFNITANHNNGFTYQWYRNNTLLNDIDSLLTDSTAGFYYVMITDSNGCRDLSNGTNVRIICLPPDDIYQIRMSEKEDYPFSIVPNPSNGKFTLFFNKEIQSSSEIIISDALAKSIYTGIITNNSKTISIDLSNQSPGIYLCRLIINNEVYLKKLVIN